MRIIANIVTLCLVLALIAGPTGVLAQTLEVTSTLPVQNDQNAAIGTDISVTFSADVNAATISSSSFVVHTTSTGQHAGTISYDAGTQTATYNPDVDFAEGELVLLTLTDDITSTTGDPLTGGYCWSFYIETGQCAATFVDGPVYFTGNDSLNFIVDVDLNNDGLMDIVTPRCGTWAHPGSKIAVFINNGDGSFASQVDYNVASYPVNIATGDFNGDGFPDVTSINWFARNFSVWFGNGTGALVTRADFPVIHTPNGITTADVNGDGHTDIITASRIYQNLGVFINDGTGAFGSPTFFPIGAPPLVIVPGDFDGDGDFDIATGNHGSTTVSILINNGDATFEAPALYSSGGFRPGMIRAADYNNDGELDIAAANYEDHNIGLLLNNGDGTFTLDTILPTTLNPFGIDVGDFDGNGYPDLVTTSRTENCATVLLNNNGVFSAGVSFPVGHQPRGIAAADYNGNGGLDLAIVSRGNQTLSVLWNSCEPGYTPPGSDVVVDLGDSLGVTFDNVISAGTTEVTTSSQGAPPPTGFKLVPSAPPVYYEITTTAVFSGDITICFTYDEADLKGPEKNLRIFHRTGDPAVWEDATLFVDEDNNLVCAVVSSLSPFVLTEVVVPVALDIKPGSCPNPMLFNPNHYEDGGRTGSGDSRGRLDEARAILPVAILGTDEFDIVDIDPATVRLAGNSPRRWAIEDVAAPVAESATECACTDAGPDGFDDLTLKFYESAVVQALGEVQRGDTVLVTITGELIDGSLFEGSDCIVIVGPKMFLEDSSPEADGPSEVTLHGYPNPFNPVTVIRFGLPEAAHVTLEIFNVAGQKVATLVDHHLGVGYHTVEWDGSSYASGLYLYRLEAGEFIGTRKMMMLK